MLEQIKHIEGLDSHQDHELFDDTPPGGLIVKFFVVAEEMPFLTAQAGYVVRQNFVHIRAEKDLGRSVFQRRVRDNVVFDETTKKWVIKKLAVTSDIRRFTPEWNAFMRGVTEDVVGTPLSVLFRHDPSRVDFYRDYRIVTVEHLANLTGSDAEQLGMGGREDISKAKTFLERMKSNAPSIETNAKLAEKDHQISSLQAQLSDLSSKLTQVLQAQLGEESPVVKRSPGRPRREVVSEQI